MIEIIDCEQGSREWHIAKLGTPSSSHFSDILAKGKGGEPSKTRLSYMRRLAVERFTGDLTESFTSGAIERGKAMEAEARDYYALLHDIEPERIGFVRNGDKGCSPDSFIGTAGGIEIKTQRGDLLMETLEKGDADKIWIPPEHVAQIQGNIWCCEREWWDLIIYWPKMPVFIRRIYRDENYIAKLAEAVDIFNEELAAMVDRIRAYGRAA